MRKLLSSLNIFLKVLAENKIWAFASSAFVFFFWFTLSFYVTSPNEWIDLNKRNQELNKIKIEGDVIDAIYENVLIGLEKSQTAHDIYGRFVQQSKNEEKLPKHDDLLSYYVELNSTNNDISRAIANLDSLRSNNSEIDSYAKEFSSDLKTYQTLFDKMEGVLQSLLEDKNQEEMRNRIFEQGQALIELPLYLEKTINRMTGFEAAVNKNLQENVADLYALENDTKLFFRRFYLAIFGVVYILCFVFIAVIKWHYYYKSKKRKRYNKTKRKSIN